MRRFCINVMKAMGQKSAVVALSCLLCFPAMAQQDSSRVTVDKNSAKAENRDAEGKFLRGPYSVGKASDNFFISVSGGINILEGPADNESGKGRIAPALDVSFGKWFTPSVGLRLGYSGLSAKGWSDVQTPYAPSTADGQSLYPEKFGLAYVHGDVLWNISNTIGGYKAKRFWDFVPFVNAGWLYSYGLKGVDAHSNELGFGVGLLNIIRLTDRVDLTLEAEQLFMRNEIGMISNSTKKLTGLTSVTLGVSVNLGKLGFERKPADALLLESGLPLDAWVAPAANRDSLGSIVRGPYATNRFWDNTFIGVGGGIHILESDGDGAGSAGGRVSPALDVYVGKWLTPSLGLRLGYTGLSARGWSMSPSPYTVSDAQPYRERFGLSYLHGDILWNISNTIGGYKEDRLWDFIPYLSAGWLHSYSLEGAKAHEDEVAVAAGLINNIRLSKRVDLNLEISQLFTQESIARPNATGLLGMTSVTLGVSVNLGKTSFDRVRDLPDLPLPKKPVKEEEVPAGGVLAEDSSDMAPWIPTKGCTDTVEIVKEVEVFAGTVSPGAVFFEIGQTTLSSRELFHLDFYVRNVIALDKDKVFTLTGCADKETGYPARNYQLSKMRVDYVYNLLKTKYNIPESRLIIKAVGAENNRFDEPELNRAVILE